MGRDAAHEVEVEVRDSESDIDYPVVSSDCQSAAAESRRDIEGSSGTPEQPAGTFRSFTDSIHRSSTDSINRSSTHSINSRVEDRNSPSEITTPTSLRREGYLPEGSSNDNLDVTTQTVDCTESNPSLWSVDGGIYSARNNRNNTRGIASHSDVIQSDSCLESVQETSEPFVSSSQSASENTNASPGDHIT